MSKQDLIGMGLVLFGAAMGCGLAWHHPDMTDRELWLNHPGPLLVVLGAIALGGWLISTGGDEGEDED